MEIFNGVDLNDSFVLGWRSTVNSLAFEIEASIWPNSIFYSEPKPNEFTCYKNASLWFKEVKSIEGLKSMAEATSTKDPYRTIDYGNIDYLSKTKNGYMLGGDFGDVQLVSGEIGFEIHT